MHLRDTARVLLIDERRRVLLFHIDDGEPLHPSMPGVQVYWLTPGGGCEPGESFEQTAVRELMEETGLSVERLGPLVWYHERLVDLRRGRTLLRERFFLAHIEAPQVSLATLLPYEQLTHLDYRWWSAEELAASGDVFMPVDLPRRLPALLDGQIPAEPLQIRS